MVALPPEPVAPLGLSAAPPTFSPTHQAGTLLLKALPRSRPCAGGRSCGSGTHGCGLLPVAPLSQLKSGGRGGCGHWGWDHRPCVGGCWNVPEIPPWDTHKLVPVPGWRFPPSVAPFLGFELLRLHSPGAPRSLVQPSRSLGHVAGGSAHRLFSVCVSQELLGGPTSAGPFGTGLVRAFHS